MKSSMNKGMRQSHKIIMTQTLRQSIEMLQLSTVELAELINSEFLENPLLEELNTTIDTDTLEEGLNRNLSGEEEDTLRMEKEIYTNPDSIRSTDGTDFDRRRAFIENAVSVTESLKDHLLWQARMTAADEREYSLYEQIITLLDENGFLPGNWRDMTRFSDAGRIIEVIRGFDPEGCATGDVKEGLLVQARYFYPDDMLLHNMIADYFHEIEKLDWGGIAKATGQHVNVVIEKSRLLQNLNPFPGSAFASKEIKYIIPDIEVKLVDGEILLSINDDWLPAIGISSYYESLIAKKNSGKEERDYLTAKLQSAKSFIKNISTRRETILKVSMSIMSRQREFLEKGPGHLRYLTHHDIAGETGVHESTVSRVASNKFVQTSWGVFELKYFFVSKIKSSQGDNSENSSSDRVRGLLLEIIQGEDPGNPYNDEELASKLKEKGVIVARRTIVKYRNMLNIPSSGKRKKINMIKS
ncbi:MAG: RNA polymerase factor sigma-54 [Spirochaetes bacterium]|nr:RNA polymerase factor sigma-54 [Spirochaetota bacterium]